VGPPHSKGLPKALGQAAWSVEEAAELDMRFQQLGRFLRRSIQLVSLALIVLGAATGRASADDSLYDVAKISLDTTAKDAVAARNIGMAEAEMRAMKIVLGRLVPQSVLEQLPALSKDEVEGMVTGFSIRKEQNSTTRYIATLDVGLNEQAVKEYLLSQGIPYSENRAPSISVLPLMIAGDSVTGEGPDGWWQAWEDLDLAHSITPATVLRPRQDLDAAVVKAALAGDAQALASMQSNYGYGGLVIAVGEVRDGKFTTRLVGSDGVGDVNFKRADDLGGADPKKAASAAAAAAFAMLENRWKVTQSGGELPAESAAYEEGAPAPGPAPQEQPSGPVEVPRNVAALVEFSGLRDWQEIRTRLTQIAGLQDLEVNALSARTASITFDFAGSLDRLQTALGQNGFALDDRNGTFVLRSR
jgi:hypothetical protein